MRSGRRRSKFSSTMRSVPPAIGSASGCAARAASASPRSRGWRVVCKGRRIRSGGSDREWRPMTEYAISYGKAEVPVYRRGAAGRDNALLAAHVSVEVLGDNFLPAYTEGDNSMVVATDSMKNLILRETGSWTGATLESLLHHLGGPPARRLRPDGRRAGVGRGDPLRPGRAARDAARADPRRRDDRPAGAGPRRRRRRHRGSADRAARDRAPEADRQRLHRVRARRLHDAARAPRPAPLGRHRRRLALPRPAGRPGGRAPGTYVAGPQVRDICAAVFEDLVSESIQHLVHAMGARLLERCPGWPRSPSRRATSPATRWSRGSSTPTPSPRTARSP